MTLKQIIQRNPLLRASLAGPRALRRQWLGWRQRPVHELLRRFESAVVGDVVIRVGNFDGDFAIGPRSHLLHRCLAAGEYEPELARLFASLVVADRDVLDIGANIGFFSVLAARHLTTGKVLAAEPTPGAHRRLVANLERNGVSDKVIVYNGLVTAVEGDLEINIVEGMEEYSSIGTIVHPSAASRQAQSLRLPGRPIDALVRDHGLNPALIKVDVEGAELAVFEGARETLRKHRPVVISEFSPKLLKSNGSSPEAIISLFESMGYKVRDPFDPLLKPGASGFGDIIAVPD